MKNIRKYIIAGIVLVAIIAIISAFGRGNTPGSSVNDEARWNGIKGEPTEIVSDFYQKWITDHIVSTDVATRTAFLAGEPLAESLRASVANTDSIATDPVLCRRSESDRIRVQSGFVTDTAAQVLVLAPSADFADGYAIVDLSGKEGSWQIEKITCATGELVPEKKEFSFDFDGVLVKQVPPPFKAGSLHIIYKDTTQQVGLVPLQIGTKTTCVQADDKTVACDDTFLVEAADVHVYGSMTETGVDVARIERK